MLLYPDSPVSIPCDLMKLPFRYHYKAWAAIFAIILFFILYLLLIFATLWLLYEAMTLNIEFNGIYSVLFYIGAILGTLMLFVFTLKFSFKLTKRKPKNRVKLKKEENLSFFNFVNKICEETKAPRPKAIYVDPDVNAYVSYTNQITSLVLPTRKELTVGMGLISCLDLNEFKAVIAHEFGHFSQRSMRIGSYINSANTIIHDMIFTRDAWDETLAKWRSVDIRLSFAAWVITPVIWCLRQLLLLFYQLLNILHLSLSREMEFNADKVAVSVAGSDAIVSALWKLQGGQDTLNNSLNFAFRASQSNHFTENIFKFHQQALISKFQENEKNLEKMDKHPMGGKRYFSDDKHSSVSMYSSHPANAVREENAKNPFVQCSSDYRSPWLLFENSEMIQTQITEVIYREYFGKKPEKFSGEEEFLRFWEEEKMEKEVMAIFKNNFNQRFVIIPELDEQNFTDYTHEQALQKSEALMSELDKLLQPINEIHEILEKVQEMASGSKKVKKVSYKGCDYYKKEAKEIYDKLIREKQTLYNESFIEWDKDFFCFYASLAKKNNVFPELKGLFDQHLILQPVFKKIIGVFHFLVKNISLVQFSENEEQVSGYEEFIKFKQAISDSLTDINKNLEQLTKMRFIPLSNIPDLQHLLDAIVVGGPIRFDAVQSFQREGIIDLANRLQVIAGNCNWVDQKSIQTIIRFISETGKSFGINYTT